ncbi:terpene synthase family protein [Microtetraspora malaysiensis]|uniref:terpene synthase family protein n=1 Tax=Microtetraspora malaysiensis TaxID=161358 RepID=UPI003D8DEF4E
MAPSVGDADELLAATLNGKTAAVAAKCQRDLRACAAEYPDLFPGSPFDDTLFGTVALANAFGSPGEPADRLRIACRTALWIFAADWLIDYVAKSKHEIDAIVEGCLAVADGDAPGTPLTRFLADIRAELAGAPAFEPLGTLWRDELERMLVAMAREWDWKTGLGAGTDAVPPEAPTFEQYLDNADNFGSTFVNVSHWIFLGEPAALGRLDELREASGEVQRVLRLLNDLATYERDRTWGDLNAQMLGVTREYVRERVAFHAAAARKRLQPLTDVCPGEVVYLERQIGYSAGFYGITDYWGHL